MLAEAEAGPPANQPLISQPEVDLPTTASPSPSSFDAATITLEIQALPEHPGVPHRFNDPSRSQHAFPHAIVASKQREGEHEYQLDITRQATLSLKFNALPEGYPITEMWLDLMLKPSLEIEDNGHWRLATTADFPGRKVHPITKTPPLFHEPIWAFPSPLELTVHLQLDVLSSQTYPAHSAPASSSRDLSRKNTSYSPHYRNSHARVRSTSKRAACPLCPSQRRSRPRKRAKSVQIHLH